MYRGSNPTALQSQQWLTDSLIALMEEKPFAQISVQELCRRADLSRQTFYNFFSSKEEILHRYLQQQCEQQFARYRNNDTLTVEQIVTVFSTILAQNERLLRCMLRSGLDGILADEVAHSVALFAGHFVSPCDPPGWLPYSEALLSGALAQLIVFWFGQEQPLPPQQLNALLTEFFLGRLFGLRRG